MCAYLPRAASKCFEGPRVAAMFAKIPRASPMCAYLPRDASMYAKAYVLIQYV